MLEQRFEHNMCYLFGGRGQGRFNLLRGCELDDLRLLGASAATAAPPGSFGSAAYTSSGSSRHNGFRWLNLLVRLRPLVGRWRRRGGILAGRKVALVIGSEINPLRFHGNGHPAPYCVECVD